MVVPERQDQPVCHVQVEEGRTREDTSQKQHQKAMCTGGRFAALDIFTFLYLLCFWNTTPEAQHNHIQTLRHPDVQTRKSIADQ